MSSSNDDTILPPPRKPSQSNGLDGETVLPSNNTIGIHNPGDVIDNRYKVIREIGRGGMGVVYEVLDALTDDHYAVKRLLPFFATRPEIVKQFWSEGAASMRFTNQSRLFVTTQTVGQDQGLPYIVMELVSFPTLRAIMNKTGAGLVLNDALSILKAVAASLAELHSMGYIHRDLKPENIFISEHAGNVTAFLSDFGLTKDGLASTATVMKGAGTERYASPEQKKGLPTTPATDIYAFGVIAYELLTGELPTGGDRLSDFVENVPDEFEQLIVSCLSSRIDRRPESGQLLVTRFEMNQKVTERIQEAEGGNDTVSDDRYHVFGTINLVGLPEPAEVFIDSCRVSGYRHIVELKTESQLVNLLVNSPEYKPFTRNVRLMPSMTTDVMVIMERLPVYISDDVDDYPCLWSAPIWYTSGYIRDPAFIVAYSVGAL